MIPNWISGVLPPIRPGAAGHSSDRSPYLATFPEVVDRFATTPERIQILRGLFAYRIELAKRGIATGFQWLNGSFMEDKESLLSQPPGDIDVVTFFHLPAGVDEKSFSPTVADLFDTNQTKPQYHVDAYPCLLGTPMEQRQVKTISYWYSMWSHRRQDPEKPHVWKGFIQVNLSASDDIAAKSLLDTL